VMHPQRGTYVFEPGEDEVRELCELRGLLESGAARILAAQGPRGVARLLAGIAADARKALLRRDWNLCEALDTQFHETLVANCGNRLLIEAYRAISGRVRAIRRCLPASRARIAHGIAEHAAIARALAKGDGEAAAAVLGRHVDNVRRLVTQR
jgi:DNA-binding GntR family transcriptional regulator